MSLEMQQWIPVNEEMPQGAEPDSLYWISDGDVVLLAGFMPWAEYGERKWFDPQQSSWEYRESITHWMPIEKPEPPC